MCTLDRSLEIKDTVWGRWVLFRNLTDCPYSLADPPFVHHDRGTELLID
jgi:hypothetical protein